MELQDELGVCFDSWTAWSTALRRFRSPEPLLDIPVVFSRTLRDAGRIRGGGLHSALDVKTTLEPLVLSEVGRD